VSTKTKTNLADFLTSEVQRKLWWNDSAASNRENAWIFFCFRPRWF